MFEAKIIKVNEEINKLTNEFTIDKKHKESDLHSLTDSVNKVQLKYNDFSHQIDKLNSVSHKDKIDELNKLRSDMDSVIEVYNKKNAEIKEYMENLGNMCTVFQKFNGKYVQAIQKVADE